MGVRFVPILLQKVPTEKMLGEQIMTKYASVIRNEIREDLRKPTRTWKNKPSFKTVILKNPSEISVEVLINIDTRGGKQYLWLDEGTREHVIGLKDGFTKNGKKHLKIPKTFRSKTIPKTLTSRKGGYSEDAIFTADDVKTFTEARHFVDTVMSIWAKRIDIYGEKMMEEIFRTLS